MLFLKKNMPPFFGLLIMRILSHKKIKKIDQYKLIAYVELFKFPF